MAEPIDWDIIAQRIATEAGILDPERIGGITAENFETEIDPLYHFGLFPNEK